ncbi:MAG TPA: translation elongation factor Ts [Candidatus Binatia bacterium]|nr:translation elongation factor Ts [Candidatus Binatia bacterium]
MSVDAKTVKDLRDRTGAGMMDCKKALGEAEGDLERAVSILREKGLAGAAKKAGRVAAEGAIGIYSSADAKSAVILELNCETDFVAKTEPFRALLDKLGNALLAASASEGTGETAAEVAVEGGQKVGDVLREAVASIGENIGLRRFTKYTTSGVVGSYVHAGGKIGVVVEVEGADARHVELAKSLAMQVAAAFPRYVSRDQVGENELSGEREIFKQQALASGKPEKIVDKIVEGRIEKFYGEACLLEQEYVRDSDVTITKLIAGVAKETGSELRVKRFSRFQLGEGIEKKQSNLAAEVAQTIGHSA